MNRSAAEIDWSERDVPRRGEQSESKPEASPGVDAPEEAASNAVEESGLSKKRATHRSRITGLENLWRAPQKLIHLL